MFVGRGDRGLKNFVRCQSVNKSCAGGGQSFIHTLLVFAPVGWNLFLEFLLNIVLRKYYGPKILRGFTAAEYVKIFVWGIMIPSS